VCMIFSAPVNIGLAVHPASDRMGNFSLPGVKRPERGVDHPCISIAEVKVRVELYTSPFGHSWPVIGRALPLPFTGDMRQVIVCNGLYRALLLHPKCVPEIRCKPKRLFSRDK